MSCHICFAPEANEYIKCKLCCDGLEHTACERCRSIYAVLKGSIGIDDATAERAIIALSTRRKTGIEKLRSQKEKTLGGENP